jgi:hypothetical protein
MARKTKAQKLAESGEGIYKYECFASEAWDWSSFRIADAPIEISVKGWTMKDGTEVPSRRLEGTMGHRCSRCGIGILAWGNGGPFVWSCYLLWCPNCHGGWNAPHKYIWGLVQEVLKTQGIEVADAAEEEETEDEDSDQAEASDDERQSQLEVRNTPDPAPSKPEKKPRKPRSKKND